MQPTIKFHEFVPMIDIGFWSYFAKQKIENIMLNQSDIPLTTYYRSNNYVDQVCALNLDVYSFQEYQPTTNGPIHFPFSGTFRNYNTAQQFNNAPLQQIHLQLTQKMFLQISNCKSYPQNNLLQFLILSFADLKSNLYSYHIMYPFIKINNVRTKSYQALENTQGMNRIIRQWNQNHPGKSFFVAYKKQQQYTLASIDNWYQFPDPTFFFFDLINNPSGPHISINNYLAIILKQKQLIVANNQTLSNIKIVIIKDCCYHNIDKQMILSKSKEWVVDLTQASFEFKQNKILPINYANYKPVKLDLKCFMDQKILAKQAVDLNIKLMKWRLLPSLNIPKIMNTKCLLFGAGTLGCQLARNLIGWGIKNISFIDYSTVSYSNPVRQSLYQFEDTINGGKPKAQTAAQKLRKIYPQINCEGYNLSVPMPGHYVTTQAQILKTFQTIQSLEKLVQSHDALFLLLDSREARWLPTVLANKYNKACITVGLGFDTFVIIRHGMSPKAFDPTIHRQRPSCYFCNDIVTPTNSMKDRTLDQMCTVTRPGLSFVSSAYASQLFISLLHHPLQHGAPASEIVSKMQETELGLLPQHIRGSMSDFDVHLYYGRAFEQQVVLSRCVACSEYVLQQYLNKREEFVLRIINDPDYLHQVTKLKQELQNMENLYFEMDDQIEIIKMKQKQNQ